jgi:hypothetical protein
MRPWTDRPPTTELRRRRPAARALAAVIVGLVVAGTMVLDAVPGGAQAAYVTVAVHPEPLDPQPGDDVAVTVRVASCPPGVSVVELLLASSDQNNDTSAAVMAESAARTSLLWRTKAVLDLPDAIEGWYGARVRCGTFVPDHVPMANTYFAVGANPTKESSLSATEVVEGSSLRFEGTGCPGPAVEYEVQQFTGRASTFVPSGSIATNPDGSWGADILFPAELPTGRANVEARCTIQNRYGETVYISYGRPIDVVVLRAPDAPTVPPAAPPVPPAP